jgi:FtsP/CotA-like multicopper oxidase with cupredoxin domain
MRTLKHGVNKLQLTALDNRQELIRADLHRRRDLLKLGLLSSAGYLVAKRGLSSRASGAPSLASPPTRPFIEPLPIIPIKQPVGSLTPTPTIDPNTAAGESRTRSHQAFTQFPPRKFYQVTQREAQVNVSPDLPAQTIWGFDGMMPGPTYVQRYGEPILVRNVNSLPTNNGGFGKPSVTTHLHNNHTPSESDGFPCDFFEIGHFYDQHYPGVLAGINSTHPGTGDINEAMSTLWYHDHRADFTAQNVYKGLAGFLLLFNQFDTGDETTGFRLPSGEFDVPMLFADKVFDPRTGLLFFDLFNLDGIIGDKFLVNGKVQPFFQVRPRRYRLRWLNGGPSRFYQYFLTDPNNLSARNPYWQITSDGNLLPRPIQVESVRLGVAERADVIIDFAPFAGKSIFLENRLEQQDGTGPTGTVLGPGQGNQLLRFDVVLPSAGDGSQDPATVTKYYDLPSTAEAPRVRRTFVFDNSNGGWTVNGKFFDCNENRFSVQQNTVEQWTLVNAGGGWQHPIHIHFEEFQTLSIDGRPPGNSPLVQTGRKDVMRLEADTQATVFFRFRDFLGRYPMHCHNTVHEDHAMMLRFEIATVGDTNQNP